MKDIHQITVTFDIEADTEKEALKIIHKRLDGHGFVSGEDEYEPPPL